MSSDEGASRAGPERPLAEDHVAERIKLTRLLLYQMILFFPQGLRYTHDWNGRLDFTRAFNQPVLINRNSHGPTGNRPKRIHSTTPILSQGWTGNIGKPFRQLAQFLRESDFASRPRQSLVR